MRRRTARSPAGALPLAVVIALAAGWCRSRPPACCRWCRVSSATSPGCPRRRLAERRRSRLVLGTLLFVLGFSVVFIVLGVVASAVGSSASRSTSSCSPGSAAGWSSSSRWSSSGWGRGSGSQRTLTPRWRAPAGLLGAPLLGAVFALGWAPCTGPTLAAILALTTPSAATAGSSGAASSSPWPTRWGSACPSSSSPRATRGLGRTARGYAGTRTAIHRFGGALLLVLGVLMVTGTWTDVTTWMQAHLVGASRRCSVVTDESTRRGGARRRRQPPAADHPAAPRADRLAALGLAPAHLDAHGAVPAPAAVGRRRAGVDLPAALDRRRSGSPTSSRPTPRRGRSSTGWGSSTSTPRSGSPRSTCCSSSRSWGASCRAAGCTGGPCGPEPPRAPRRLERLDEHLTFTVDGTPDEARDAARALLRRRRFPSSTRTTARRSARRAATCARPATSCSTSRSAWSSSGSPSGHLFGWRGDVILTEGDTFSSTVSSYDVVPPGPLTDPEHAAAVHRRPEVDRRRQFEEQVGGAQFGAPRSFTADVDTTEQPGGAATQSRRSAPTTR